mgnify:CR=1 FL=1
MNRHLSTNIIFVYFVISLLLISYANLQDAYYFKPSKSIL